MGPLFHISGQCPASMGDNGKAEFLVRLFSRFTAFNYFLYYLNTNIHPSIIRNLNILLQKGNQKK